MMEYKGNAPRHNEAANQMMRFYDEYSSSRVWTYKHEVDALARADGIAAKLIDMYDYADFSFNHDSLSMCLTVHRPNTGVVLSMYHRSSFNGGFVYAVELDEYAVELDERYTVIHCDGDNYGIYDLPPFYYMSCKNVPDVSD